MSGSRSRFQDSDLDDLKPLWKVGSRNPTFQFIPQTFSRPRVGTALSVAILFYLPEMVSPRAFPNGTVPGQGDAPSLRSKVVHIKEAEGTTARGES